MYFVDDGIHFQMFLLIYSEVIYEEGIYFPMYAYFLNFIQMVHAQECIYVIVFIDFI